MNFKFRHLTRCLALAAALASTTASHALTVSAGQTWLFNVDLTALSPAPPSDHVTFFSGLVVNTLDAGDVGTWTVFGSAGAVDPIQVPGNPSLEESLFSQTVQGNSASAAKILDGIFSFTFHLEQGEIDINPSAFGRIDLGNNEHVDSPTLSLRGVLLDATVPEPATPALALLAFAGMACARRRTMLQR